MAKYTKEDESFLVQAYTDKTMTVQQLAEHFTVPERSIIAKLSSLGVYQRKQYLNKSGQPPVKKATLADQLGKLLKLHDFETEQLEKLSKPLLTKVIQIIEEAGI